jgi:hypothetical protein
MSTLGSFRSRRRRVVVRINVDGFNDLVADGRTGLNFVRALVGDVTVPSQFSHDKSYDERRRPSGTDEPSPTLLMPVQAIPLVN